MAEEIDLEKSGITKEDVLAWERLGIAVRVPENLYKYYRINDGLLSTIRENYFWLSRPMNFNDPFDARILVNTDNSAEEIDEHISGIFEQSELKDDARNMFKDLKAKDPELFNNFVNAHMLFLLENIGISCFTTKHNNLLMWAHYADNHRGVCIKFNLLEDKEITGMLHPVEYSMEYPKINFIEMQKAGNYPDLFLTKSLEWQYEEEWRIVRTEYLPVNFGEEGDPSEPKNYGKLPFKKEALMEVIFGCKASDEDIDKVITAFKEANYKGVSFKKADMVDFLFDLSFKEILSL